jgi:formate C-acetyltransferase
MNHFGDLHERTAVMRERMLNTSATVCTERAALTSEAYKRHEMDQVVLRRAHTLKNILQHMSIYIDSEALLVGNQAGANRAAPIFPEYAMDWVMDELDAFAERDGDRFEITEDSKQTLREIYPYWKGRTLQDKGYAAFPEEARMFYDLGIIKTEGNITSGDAHIAVEYEKILREGLSGVRIRTQSELDRLDLAQFEDLKKSYFYRAILITVDAVETYALRFAELAEEQAKAAAPERRVELLEIARICRKVPMQPAESFHEALQSIWFIHVILQIESNGHSLSYGRLDQYCLPYYEKSKAAGMTDEAACELLENLWLRTYSVNKIRSWSHTKFSAGSPLYQNVTVGGQTAGMR